MDNSITDFASEMLSEDWNRLLYQEQTEWIRNYINPNGELIGEIIDKDYCISKLMDWFRESLEKYNMISNDILLTAVVDSVDYNTLYSDIQSFYDEHYNQSDSSSDDE